VPEVASAGREVIADSSLVSVGATGRKVLLGSGFVSRETDSIRGETIDRLMTLGTGQDKSWLTVLSCACPETGRRQACSIVEVEGRRTNQFMIF
jgi:hypothetical protein